MDKASEDGCDAQDLLDPPVLVASFPAFTQGTDETPVLRFPQQILLAAPQHRVLYVPVIHPATSLASGCQPFPMERSE
jgi:hypothetical protein